MFAFGCFWCLVVSVGVLGLLGVIGGLDSVGLFKVVVFFVWCVAIVRRFGLGYGRCVMWVGCRYCCFG